MYKVLVTDKLSQAGLDILESAEDVELVVKPGLTESEIIAIISEFDALLIRSGTKVTESIIDAADGLKLIGRAGVGVDNVDLDAATRKGIIVMNTPSANTVATAELAMALMLASARHIIPAHNSLSEGKWERSNFTGTELSQKRLGIVGFGRIGKAVAIRAKSFGMHVSVYDPYIGEATCRELDVESMTFDDLVASSDYVTLHTVLNDETKHLINKETLAKFKPGSVLINVARGGLVDEQAIADALNDDVLSCFATDVYSSEPPSETNPVVSNPKVIHTPHLGASTKEAQIGVAVEIANQCLDALRGVRINNCVNLSFAASMGFDRIAPFIELSEKIGLLQASMVDEPITAVEVEVCSELAEHLIKPVAAGLLKGILHDATDEDVNYVNAPVIGEDRGLEITRVEGISDKTRDSITCRVSWDGGQRIVAGKVFDENMQRITRISDYRFEADPTGLVLLMLNKDVPGVIGSVGTKLGEQGVNIAEWRLARDENKSEALSFINLDCTVDELDLDALRPIDSISKIITVNF